MTFLAPGRSLSPGHIEILRGTCHAVIAIIQEEDPAWDAGMDWEPLQLPDPPPVKKGPEAEFRVPTPVEFGLCVRARRHQLKIGQLDLAARAGVSRQWIVSLERGKGGIELALVLRTLAILNLDLRLLVWAPPDWSVPLTAAAGTAARPYGKGRLWRVPPEWGKE